MNQHALAERLRELQLKQWWVARQIGVTPLTVNRWLTGKVRRIGRDNLARLAGILNCDELLLVIVDETDVLATQVEQTEAARLLVSRETQGLFSSEKKYEVYEQLLRAVMHPNMTASQLADIYSRLSAAAAGQGKLEQVRAYAERGLEYAVRSGNTESEFQIRNNLIAVEGQTGNLRRSILGLQDLASAAESIGHARARTVALLNLIYALRLAGKLSEAIDCANEAIRYCNQSDEKRLQGNALSNCSLLALDLGHYQMAVRLRQEAERRGGTAADTTRGAVSIVFEQLCNSLEGQAPDLELLRQQLPILLETGLHDGFAMWPVVVLRRAGELTEAEDLLNRMEARTDRSAYDQPFVLEERARLALARGKRKAAQNYRAAANLELKKLGMEGRCCEDPQAEYGMQFPRPTRPVLREPWKDKSSIWH